MHSVQHQPNIIHICAKFESYIIHYEKKVDFCNKTVNKSLTN